MADAMGQSPWQTFQGYLLEKMAAWRQLTFSNRRSLMEQSGEQPSQFDYFYSGQDLAISPVFALPQEVLLAIFCRLSCADLCRCAAVCRLWRQVSEDPLLWSARLVEDSRKWPFASNLTFVDKELSAKAPAKAAYLRCSPEFAGGAIAPSPQSGSPATRRKGAASISFFRSWFPRRNPQFLLSEGDPSLKFMRQVLHDNCNAFVPVSMFSAAWFGNSGLTFKMSSEQHFDLVNFSHSSPRIAEIFGPGPPQEEQPLSSEEEEEDEEEGARTDIFGSRDTPEPSLALNADFASYVMSIDGLIFLVNAQGTAEELRRRRAEFGAVRRVLAQRPHIPIVIYSIVFNDEKKRKCSCVAMARFLRLIQLTNPWLIIDAKSKGLHRVIEGFHWLLNRQAS